MRWPIRIHSLLAHFTLRVIGPLALVIVTLIAAGTYVYQQAIGKSKLLVLGVAYKPDIDDLRESPALEIVRALGDRHAGPILAVEPHVAALPAGLGRVRHVDLDAAVAADDFAREAMRVEGVDQRRRAEMVVSFEERDDGSRLHRTRPRTAAADQ